MDILHLSLASPTRVLGVGELEATRLESLALYLSGSPDSPLLLVRDARPFPALDPALAALAARRPLLSLDRVVPNPRSEDIGAMVEEARRFLGGERAGLVLGVGGGSALDSAKALALMLANPGELDDYLGPAATRRPETRGPKLLLIPTTTGTGAEVTRFGVYTARSGRKYTLATPFLQPDAALLVGAAVRDIPPPLLAATAYDAITHALETLWHRGASPLSDSLAQSALVALLGLARPAYEARREGRVDGPTTGLLEAACAAGIAFNLTGTAAIHALSFVLSEEWKLPHGAACAFFTDAVYARNSAEPRVRAKLAAVARELGACDGGGRPFAAGEEGEEGAAAWLGSLLLELRSAMGLPGSFGDLGLGAAELPETRIAALFDKVQEDPKLRNNAVALDAEAVRALVRAKLA